MECLNGPRSCLAKTWHFIASNCCCCLHHRVARILSEPHIGHPSFAKRRAKPRALPCSPAPGALPSWPCKGGDAARTGAPGISATRNLKEPAWSYFTDAVTYSTNVLDAAGNIYLNVQSGLVLCLNPSGDERWRYKLNGYFPPCPALLNGAFFTLDNKGNGYSLDMVTGKELWVRKYEGEAGSDCWAVAAADGLVVFQSNVKLEKRYITKYLHHCHIFGVDPSSGDEMWRYRVEAALFNVMPTIAAGKVFFSSSDTDLYCLDTKTGQEVWSLPGWKWEKGAKYLSEAPRALGSITIYRDDCIYITGNPSISTGTARAHRAGTGEQLWSRDFDQHVGNAAALSDACGVLTMVVGVGHTAPKLWGDVTECPPYLGTVYGLNAKDGEVRWRCEEAPPLHSPLCPGQHFNSLWPRLNLPDSFSMPAIGGDGTVYIGWQAGFILAIDGATGKLLSSFENKEGIQGQPTIGPAGELVVAAGRHLLCFAD